jgi:predicted nucleic acid-binding protein
MKPLIFDATPLIYLTRIGFVNLIERMPEQKFVARSVFGEVVEQGKAKGLADALVLARLFEAKAISILDAEDAALLRMFSRIRGLGESDAETLVIAKEHGYRAILDDLLARKVAKTYGIDFVGTPFILILGIQDHLLTKQDALKAVDDMIKTGWRCGPEIYREITRLIQES